MQVGKITFTCGNTSLQKLNLVSDHITISSINCIMQKRGLMCNSGARFKMGLTTNSRRSLLVILGDVVGQRALRQLNGEKI